MSIEEFIRRNELEGRFELIDGEIVPLSPTVFGHSWFANLFQTTINGFAQPRGLGAAFLETTFVKPDASDRDWVKGSRIPDVLFVTASRLAEYRLANPDWLSRPLALIPNLVIEIVSPTDNYSEVGEKVQRYLDDGVLLVWVFDAQQRNVTVHRQGSNQQIKLTEHDMLDGEEVIPGLQIPLHEFFEQAR